VKLDILHALNAERAARHAVAVVTDVASGEQRLVRAADVARDPLKDVIEKHLRMAKSGMEETAQGRVFITVHVPSPQLVITGAVHISQTLAPLGAMLGYDVTIVDPRTAFASQERFPDVKLIAEWPDVALPPLNVDHYTAFVALTHDPKIDDPALAAAGYRVSHRDLNDGTVEGLVHRSGRIVSVQFHPEGAPGPIDGERVLDIALQRGPA